MGAYSGKFNIIRNEPYAADIYSVGGDSRSSPPVIIGYLLQEDGFFITQQDGSLIEITGAP